MAHHSLPPHRALAPLVALAIGVAAGSGTAQQEPRARREPLQPGAHSPLATNGEALFAVGEDERTILARPLQEGPWRPVSLNAPLGVVTGLSWGDGSLFALDRTARALVRIRVEEGAVSRIRGPEPFREPFDLAFAHHLFVSDLGGTVFETVPESGETTRLPEFFEGHFGLEAYMAGWGPDLIIGSPTNGEIWLIERAATADARLRLVKRGTASAAADVKQLASLPMKKGDSDGGPLQNLGAVTYGHGIVYGVDRGDGRIYAFARDTFRPVPLAFAHAPRRAARLLVTDDHLVVLGEDRRTYVWPRLVPTELRFDVVTLSEAMVDFYAYLNKLGVLPTRTVKLRDSIEKTLRAERVLLAPYITRLEDLLCDLNPKLCPKGQIRQILPQGADLVVPDLYVESYIDRQVVSLSGRTLGDEVRRRIKSPELVAAWNTEAKLRELNPSHARAGAASVSEAREGRFVIPAEFIRYYAAVPVSEFETGTALARLRRRYPGVHIHRLDEALRASAASTPLASSSSQTPPPTLAQLKDMFETVLKTISAEIPDTIDVSAPIVVAEKDIDEAHPDFTPDAFLTNDGQSRPLRSQGSPTEFDVRKGKDEDHGTMVAAILAARKSGFGSTGVLPNSRLFQIRQSPPAVVHDDIRIAYMNHGARVFNMSFRYEPDDPLPLALREAITSYPDAIFVVAAGNNWVKDDDQVCETFMLYPACFGRLPNVITVTATGPDGRSLVTPEPGEDPPLPGVNWNPAVVHVAAPGEGFYVAGKGHSYASARGSSFAAPLVTATAAVLHAQHLSGPAIKQRILATADPEPNLKRRVQAGLLNVRRAIMYPELAVVTEGSDSRPVKLDQPGARITLKMATEDVTVQVGRILRITRNGMKYRVVYVDRRGELQIEDDVSRDGAWTFYYFEVDDKLRRQGPRQTGDLGTLADYVGPVL